MTHGHSQQAGSRDVCELPKEQSQSGGCWERNGPRILAVLPDEVGGRQVAQEGGVGRRHSRPLSKAWL